MWERSTTSDGPVALAHGLADAGLEHVGLVGRLAQLDDVPAVGPEPAGGVVGERQLGGPVDRDVVVVVDVDQATEAQVAGQRRRLVADALLEVAVAADGEGVVVAELGAEPHAQVLLGDRHADPGGEALAQGPGGGLDADGVPGLGVARCAGAPLAERLEVVEGDVVARQVERGVLEDRRVAGREDEPVAVEPVGRGGVVPHDAGPQHGGQRCEGHGRALVTGVGGGGAVHGQPPNHVDGALFQCLGHPDPSA